MRILRIDESSPYRQLVGVGGLGSGIFFGLEGDHTLGRNESRAGHLLDVRDYCKLHIVIHYVAKLLGANTTGVPFHVVPVGKVGDDPPGRRVIDEMKAVGIDADQVEIVSGLPTIFSVCFQYPDGTGGNITTTNSAAESLRPDDIDRIAGLLSGEGEKTIALAVPEVPLDVRHHFLGVATRARAFRAASFVSAEVQPARELGMFELLDLVALNEGEAEALVGQALVAESPQPFLDACQQFLRKFYPRLRMILSCGAAGAYAITGQVRNFCPVPRVHVASTAGAGDALLGGVLAALAAGIPFARFDNANAAGNIQTALELGVLLASYKCLSPHTIHPGANADSLQAFAEEVGLTFAAEITDRIIDCDSGTAVTHSSYSA